jgi:4-diphosphocytidyl-2-C-methyl-D-erythritol kinase
MSTAPPNNMPGFRARARAKVNLALEIIRRRSDGYHELETILQTIDLYDELEIECTRNGKIDIACDNPDIPTDENNICHRAVVAMRELAGRDLGARILIRKRIPHSAGLGGGSSDAGAVLLAINEATGLKMPPERLEGVAAVLGSDVPFMLHGGTMLGRGRGEQLERLEALGGGFFVIVKPKVDISTAAVYANVNLRLTRHRYRINLKAVNSLLARFPSANLTFRNALEDVVCPSYPLVAEVLEELLATRPRFAAMSGSGSAVFAIYQTEVEACQQADRFAMSGYFTAVAEPYKRAVDLFPL